MERWGGGSFVEQYGHMFLVILMTVGVYTDKILILNIFPAVAASSKIKGSANAKFEDCLYALTELIKLFRKRKGKIKGIL